MASADPERKQRAWSARPGSWLRGVPLLPLTFAWGILAALLIAIVASLFPGWFKRRGWFLVRLWGRVPMFWHGVRLDVRGAEHARAPGAKLLLFNHVSVIDLFVLSIVSPQNAVVIYKQEFHKIPGMGRALRAVGCIAIDRSNRARALESMAAATARIRDTNAAVMIAPEGTRSRRGGLQDFKLGAFHLALETGAPIVPLIMRGIDQILPLGSVWIRSGTIGVDFLEPIPTANWSREELREHAREVRELFLEYLAPVADEPRP